MKAPVFAFAIFAATGALGTPAQAQNYPWCAQYSGDAGGASNCGFSTYEQCMATLSGNGGFCNRNTQYVPSGGSSNSDHRSRRNRHQQQ